MKRTILLFFFYQILVVTIMCGAKLVFADGVMLNPYEGSWDYSSEKNQQAFINYDNGFQKMIISVETDKDYNNGVVWLFPLPSDPNRIAIDIVNNLPRLSGAEITGEAKAILWEIGQFLKSTQLPLSIFKISPFFSLITTLGEQGAANDVTVYEHLVKEGMTTEVITAKTANGLYDYLRNKGFKIENSSIPVLDHYIGKAYSFVASWVNPESELYSRLIREKDASKRKGISVTFPTDEIYFPLLPTSVYGSKIIPITIRIMGHVSPKVFKDIKNYAVTEYCINEYITDSDRGSLKGFYNGQNKNYKYTKIDINAPSKYLTDDLWVARNAPMRTYYTSFIITHVFITRIFLWLLTSVLTGILVGWVVFKDLRKNTLKLALLGLSNCFSVFGLLIATIFVSTKNNPTKADELMCKIKNKGYIWRRRAAIIMIYFAIPVLTFTIFISSLLGIVLVSNRQFGIDSYFLHALFRSLMLCILPIILLILARIFKRIKPEDKHLFDQLNTSGYSSWSFKPKDKMKIIFVPLYSISFLIISWLIISYIMLTV